MTTLEPAVLLRPVFSIRLDTERPVQEVAASVSAALSLDLRPDGRAPGGGAIHAAGALGLWIDVVAWPPWPVEGRFTYQLQGRLGPDLPYHDADVVCDISAHVIDILERRGAGGWYIPSDEQVLRELDLGEQMESDA